MRRFFLLFVAMMFMAINSAAAESCGDFRLAENGAYAEEYTGIGGAVCIPASVVTADYNLFWGKNAAAIRELTLSLLMEELPSLTACENLERIEVPPEHPTFKSVDGVLYSKDMTRLIYYPKGKKDAVYSIPKSVTEIAGGACTGNSYLCEILLPSHLKQLGTDNFNNCSALMELKLEGVNPFFSVEEGALFSKDGRTLFAVPAGKSGAYNVPEGTEKIAYGAFSGCHALTELLLPETLLQIEAMAFEGCLGLRTLTLPDSVEQVCAASFAGCANLEALFIENSDFYMTQDGLLYSKDGLDLLFCPAGKKGGVTLPDGVKTITNGAFDNCRHITAITMPESVVTVGRAFLNCESLEHISVPEMLSIIEYCTFMGCANLKWVYLPNNVVIIKDKAFEGSSPVIYCDEDSYAEMYAQENGLPYQYMIRVELNGKQILFDQPPVLEKGNTLVPMRAIFEALGADILWNGESQTVVAQMGGKTVVLTAGNDLMYIADTASNAAVNGVRLEAAAQLINDRMMVPVRAVSEAFCAEVQWDERTKTVRIISDIQT